eukprot:5604934-Prymnesium_polylepis.1
MDAVRAFLESLSIPSQTCSISALQRCAPDLEDDTGSESSTLLIFCLETRGEADAFLARHAGRQCERQLLVLDKHLIADDHEEDISSYAAVLLDKSFATNFFEALAGKITRLAHGAAVSEPTAAAPTSQAATAASSVAGDDDALEPEDYTLIPGLRSAAAELKERLSISAPPPPPPVGRRMERKSYEAGPFAGLLTRGTVLPLGNTTLKATPDHRLVGLGLPLSAYRTVGWAGKGLCTPRTRRPCSCCGTEVRSAKPCVGRLAVHVCARGAEMNPATFHSYTATLLGCFCGLLLGLHALEAVTGDERFGESLTLPCYFVIVLGGATLGAFAFIRPPTRCGRL